MITSAEMIKLEANLLQIKEDNLILPHIITAEFECIREIGKESYDLIAGENDPASLRYKILQKAETNIAVSFLLYSLIIKSDGDGIDFISVTGADSSTIIGENYLKQLSGHYFDIGHRLLNMISVKKEESVNDNETLFIAPGGIND